MGDASVESYLREGNDANVIAVTVTAQNTYKLISQTDFRYVVSYFNFMLMDSCGQCGERVFTYQLVYNNSCGVWHGVR